MTIDQIRQAMEFGLANGKKNMIIDLGVLKTLLDKHDELYTALLSVQTKDFKKTITMHESWDNAQVEITLTIKECRAIDKALNKEDK